MNDPCAPIFFRGQYHMFHQYNPDAAVWGDMHWAHATSPDMIRWTRRPVALAPTPGGPDSDGVFTGSSVFHEGRPAIIYTGIRSVPHEQATLSDGTHNFRETQLLATSTDPDLRTWTKHSQPVIPSPPPGMQVTGFRDPAPFQFAGTQYLALGSGIPGKGGLVLLYRAAKLPNGQHDLTRWEYLHPLTEGQRSSSRTSATDPVDTGEMWECPDFFELEGRHVLIYSTERITLWQVGDLDLKTLRFHATSTGRLDQGRSFYAPKTQLDAHGNRILWGWLSESRSNAEMTAAGWSGMLSLPRILTIRDGQLHMEPLPALAQLRRSALGSAINEYTATLTHNVSDLPDNRRNGPQAVRNLSIRDPAGPLLDIDTSATTTTRSMDSNRRTLLLTGPDSLSVPILLPEAVAPIDLHVFIDNSVLELFVAGQCFTHRFYRRSPDTAVLKLSLPMGLFLDHARSWSLNPIWPA